MHDCLVIGGGVIGLSLAYELAGCHWSVQVVDRALPAQEASWAGAGILPPAGTRPGLPAPLELARLAHALHPEWSARLRAETGIDNGFRRCGGVYLARDQAAATALQAQMSAWQSQGISVQPISHAALAVREPALAAARDFDQWPALYHSEEEAQLRNPWHLQALLAACTGRGVTITPDTAVQGWETNRNEVMAARTTRGSIRARHFCVTSGAWTAELLEPLGCLPRIRPLRGQIVLLHPATGVLRAIVNDGLRYLVPREDGHLLVGATQENVGYVKETTEEGVAGLVQMAHELVPALRQVPVKKSWAGLRPATADGLPYMGPLAGWSNAFVAAGHFRSGLELSPAVATVMAALIRGETPGIDLAAFAPGRQ